MIKPDNGPAIHTSEVRVLVRPSCRRYGVQSCSFYQQSQIDELARCDGRHGLTCHLDGPGKSVKALLAIACGRVTYFLAYCSPIRLVVNRAMRMCSEEPLMEGEPVHDAA